MRPESCVQETVSSAEVLILLAAYNGALFIEEQIRSIQNQTECNWILLVRDDGSTDRTSEIIEKFASTDGRIQVLSDENGGLGATGNFSALLEYPVAVQAKYIMFADQDDVWRCEKIALMLNRIRQLEDVHGALCPLLVHSDLEVVDVGLHMIHRSYMKYQMIGNEEREPLKVLLTHNFVTGCACIINRPLADLAIPFLPGVRLHDHWIALLAAASGKIGFINESTMMYRQHGKNEIGAKSYWKEFIPLQLDIHERWKRHLMKFSNSLQVALLLKERLIERGYSDKPEVLDLIEGYGFVMQIKRRNRIAEIRRLGVRRQGFFRQLLLYGCLLSSSNVDY